MAGDAFEDLLRVVRDDPSARDRLRRELLSDELMGLPTTTARLASAQEHTEQSLQTLVGQVTALAGRVDALTQQVDALATAQERTERRLETLTARMEGLTEQVSQMADRLSRVVDRLGWVMGDVIERRYRERAHAYFQRIARRIRVLGAAELDDLLEGAIGRGVLDVDQADDLRLADTIARGQRGGQEVFLVVESSWTVKLNDVTRARDRARLLAQTGVTAIPIVAGRWISGDAEDAAPDLGVWRVTNGRVLSPPGATAA